MSSTTQPEFGKVRAALWPIHTHELKKFLPMGFIMFFILFNYTILRDTKDVLIVTAPKGGAEVIPFLKGWFVLFSAMFFFALYTKLSNAFSREQLFYGITIAFISFFGIFAFVLYPNKELIHPSQELIESLQEAYPRLKYIISIYGIWMYAIFYVLAELWGSVMVSLLFWQFANEVTRTNEAKRFYALFNLIANFALIFSGATVTYFSDLKDQYPEGVDAWGVSMKWMMAAVVLCGFLAMALYRWMNRSVLTDPRFYDAAETKTKDKKSKPKMGVLDSFKYIFSSPYLGFLAILVIGYGISINLIEVVWKAQLKIAFPDPNAYGSFMGKFSAITGIVTILLIMMTKGIVRKFGWLTGAIITPLMVFITGFLFFSFIFFNDVLTPVLAGLGLAGVTSTLIAVYIGAAQNFLSKGTKYSLFDPTKEMAYIPLDQELKVKGKAAVDVIGGRLGKGIGGYIIQALIIGTAGNILTIAPFLAAIVGVVVFSWILAVKGLNSRYISLLTKQGSSK
jgi:AAA family ATP:ADP antiporter